MELIRKGQRGERVLGVQAKLAALGYAIPPEERAGVFGQGTYDAIREFQQARGLIIDGLVGSQTWRELVEASRRLGDRVLYLRAPHMRGDDVRALQDSLATLGFDTGRVDGIFGPDTQAAVREFQRNYGLRPDGIVADGTLRALLGLPRIAGDTPVGAIREREATTARPSGLAGMRIVVDPGHGADDHGFTGPEGTTEDAAAYALARATEAALAAQGAHVFLTRRANGNPSDTERAALANTLDAHVFLALHAAGGDPGAHGAAAYYFGHERFHSESGARLAEALLEEVTALGLVDGRAHAKTFPLLRETRMTAVVLEPAYITNAEEERLLTDPTFRARLADAIARAVSTYARTGAPV
jgi:N-acetylmuramoyl-L-alanine amidase